MEGTWERVRLCRGVRYGAAAADERLDKDFVGEHIKLLLLLTLQRDLECQ